ncbi:MAG TPA: hypothetical protein VHB25_12595 [Gemmatimonadaceae bacterium]|nr:hypothetical protein [Gemmatimonadaceae bacterium]
MTAPSIPLQRRRARLGYYSLWQIRDFVLNTGIMSIVLFGLLGTIFVLQIHAQTEMFANMHRDMPPNLALRTFMELLSMFSFTAPILALNGVLATDRASGYTRFLFAKPVSPLAFYGQSAVVRVIGFLVVACVLQALWAAFEPPALTWKFVVDMTAFVITVGGIVFVLSAATKYDGLIAVVFMLLTALLRDRWYAKTGPLHYLSYLFPPLGKLVDVQSWSLGFDGTSDRLQSLPFPAGSFWWNVGYGLAMFAIGFVILRKRSLTKA